MNDADSTIAPRPSLGALWALARVVVVSAPVLLLVSVLYAAPKGAKPVRAAPAKSASSADASVDVGPREAKVPGPIGAVGSMDASVADAMKPEAGTKSDRPTPTDAGARESERKEGDASVKVFDFGSTEVTGKARWPAVTYFTRRLKAEFDAQKLPHRSFFPEGEASKGERSVR